MAIERRNDPPPPIPEPRVIRPTVPPAATSAQRYDFADAMQRAGVARDHGATAQRGNRQPTGSQAFTGLPMPWAQVPLNAVGARHGSQSGSQSSGQSQAQSGARSAGSSGVRAGGSAERSDATRSDSGRSDRSANGQGSTRSERSSTENREVEPNDTTRSDSGDASDRNSGLDVAAATALPGMLASMTIPAVQAYRSMAVMPGSMVSGGLTPEALSAMLLRCASSTSVDGGGDWHFRLPGDGHGIESLRLQQAALGGWRIRIALKPGVDESDLNLIDLESTLAKDGHRIDAIVIDDRVAGSNVSTGHDPIPAETT